MFKAKTAAVFLLAVSIGGASAGERPVPGLAEMGSRPIEIVADRLSADSARNSVIFEGNVTARQGDVTLSADRLQAEYSPGTRTIEKIVAEGNVRVTQENREARAAHGVFYNMEQRIVLSGGAEMIQGEDSLKGETVTIFLRENRSQVAGGEGGRVRAVIHPKRTEDGKKEKTGP
jgi:lipopolysaccharide export system protein LptA